MTLALGLAAARQALCVAMSALCALSLLSCFDGYPTEDVLQTDPVRMSPAQLLSALNVLGEGAQRGKHWRYALRANGELEISAHDDSTDRRRVVLEGAQVTVRSLDGVSEIRLVPEVGGEAQAVTVLKTRSWTTTVQAKSLLTLLEVRSAGTGLPDS